MPQARLSTSSERRGPIASRTQKPIPAATMPPRESVIQRARITGASAVAEHERTPGERAVAANQLRSTIAPAITAASPFQ